MWHSVSWKPSARWLSWGLCFQARWPTIKQKFYSVHVFFSNFFPLTFLMLLTLDFLQQKPIKRSIGENCVFQQPWGLGRATTIDCVACDDQHTKLPKMVKDQKPGEILEGWKTYLTLRTYIYTYIVRTVLFIEICSQVSGPAKTHGPVVIPRSESSHGKSSCESQTLWREAVHFRTHQPSNLPSKDYFFGNLGYSHTR